MVDYYIQKLEEEDFQIIQVRQELERNNVDDQEIKVIVSLVDRELQKRQVLKAKDRRSNEFLWLGAVLMFLGAGITLGTYMGLIDMGNSFLIVYGPFLSGLSTFVYGIAAKSKDDGTKSRKSRMR